MLVRVQAGRRHLRGHLHFLLPGQRVCVEEADAVPMRHRQRALVRRQLQAVGRRGKVDALHLPAGAAVKHAHRLVLAAAQNAAVVAEEDGPLDGTSVAGKQLGVGGRLLQAKDADQLLVAAGD